jgi:hypothetical protein
VCRASSLPYEEAFGRSCIALFAQEEVDRPTLLVHCSIQVRPTTLHLYIGPITPALFNIVLLVNWIMRWAEGGVTPTQLKKITIGIFNRRLDGEMS